MEGTFSTILIDIIMFLVNRLRPRWLTSCSDRKLTEIGGFRCSLHVFWSSRTLEAIYCEMMANNMIKFKIDPHVMLEVSILNGEAMVHIICNISEMASIKNGWNYGLKQD